MQCVNSQTILRDLSRMHCCTFRKPPQPVRKAPLSSEALQPKDEPAAPSLPTRRLGGGASAAPPSPPPRKSTPLKRPAAAPLPAEEAAAPPAPADQVQLSIGVLSSDSVKLSVALGALSSSSGHTLPGGGAGERLLSRGNSVGKGSISGDSSISGDTVYLSADEGDDDE